MTINHDPHANAEAGRETESRANSVTRFAMRPMRILVVDDLSSNREVLARRLVRRGHSVTEAEGGVRALELIERQDFDVVLLDIMMPDVSGVDVLRRVRQFRSKIELPIVMVSALTQSEDVVECLNMGANDYISKPIDFDVLLARLHPHVEHKSSAICESEARRQLKQDVNELLEHCERLLRFSQALLQKTESWSEPEDVSKRFFHSEAQTDSGVGRTEPRRVFKAAKIVFNGRNSVIDCIVWRQSDSGALLRVESESGVPDEFELAVGGGAPVNCIAVRRAIGEIEVRFLGRTLKH